jgi:hypothetical protein
MYPWPWAADTDGCQLRCVPILWQLALIEVWRQRLATRLAAVASQTLMLLISGSCECGRLFSKSILLSVAVVTQSPQRV